MKDEREVVNEVFTPSLFMLKLGKDRSIWDSSVGRKEDINALMIGWVFQRSSVKEIK